MFFIVEQFVNKARVQRDNNDKKYTIMMVHKMYSQKKFLSCFFFQFI